MYQYAMPVQVVHVRLPVLSACQRHDGWVISPTPAHLELAEIRVIPGFTAVNAPEQPGRPIS